MNGDVLIQNIINLFVISIIMEAAIMAIFSMSSLKSLNAKRPIEASRDALVIIISFLLCYKVDILNIFRGTGIKVPQILDIIISALVLTRMTNFVGNFMSRLRQE
jgi:hypothetical protein